MHAMVHWWADASCYVGNVAPLSRCSCSKPYRRIKVGLFFNKAAFTHSHSCFHIRISTHTKTHWSEQPSGEAAAIHGLPGWFGSQGAHRMSPPPVGMAVIGSYVCVFFQPSGAASDQSFHPEGHQGLITVLFPLTQGSGKAAFRLVASIPTHS